MPDSASLVFDLQLRVPDSAAAFESGGGRLDAAVAPLLLGLHVSGNAAAVRVLADEAGDLTELTRVRLPLDEALVVRRPNGDAQAWLRGNSRLGLQFVAKSFTIAGSIGASALGETSGLLLELFETNRGHGLYSLPYSPAWHLASAHVAVHGAHVEYECDGATIPGNPVPFFTPEPDFVDAVPRVQGHLQAIVNESARRRTEDLRFEMQPNLMKSVAATVGGFAGSNYASLGFMLDHGVSMSYEALDSALRFALQLEVGPEPEQLERLLAQLKDINEGDFRQKAAAAYAAAVYVSGALSTIVGSLMSYRVDGAPVVLPEQSTLAIAEKWSPQAQEIPGVVADDCDRSATQLHNTVLELQRASPETRARFPAIGAVAALLDHYSPSLVVLAARSPEASGAGHGPKQPQAAGVAGHAVALLTPKQDLVRALLAGAALPKSPLAAARGGAAAYADALWRELYPPALRAGMGAGGRAFVERSYEEVAAEGRSPLPPLALEGTTPSSGLLYLQGDSSRRAELHRIAGRERQRARALGDGAGRALKSLAALGSSPDEHGFYLSMVEQTHAWSHPLFGAQPLREMLGAVEQLAFTSGRRDGGTTCGASPRDIACGDFELQPILVHGAQRTRDLEVVGAVARKDVFPPVRTPTRVGSSASARVAALRRALEAESETPPGEEDGSLVYVLPVNSVLMNSRFSLESVAALRRASSAPAFLQPVPGLLADEQGGDCGFFAAVFA